MAARHRTWALAVALGLALAGAPAAAQQKKTDVDLAAQHYKLGAKFYERGKYKPAIEQFEEAYRISKRPELLYNMGRCYEALGDDRAAIKAYEGFLEREDKGDKAKQVKLRLVELYRRTRATEDETPLPGPGAPTAKALGWKTTAGWSLVAAGGALLITGAVLGGLAGGKANELGEASRTPGQPAFSDYADLEDGGKALQTGQIATLIAGGVVAAAGVLLLVNDAWTAPEVHRAWLAPVLSAGGPGLAGGVRF